MQSNFTKPPLRVGIGGPVGSGKTSLLKCLCSALHNTVSIGVITNDIYTTEDATALTNAGVLDADRIIGVETGGCPHTAIREDASMNQGAIADITARHPDIQIVFIESGGDNLAATFSPELVDMTLYVIDVACGQDIPRKGGPAITKSDMLVINKIDLAPFVEVDMHIMAHDTKAQRGDLPFVFTNLKIAEGVPTIVDFIIQAGMIDM